MQRAFPALTDLFLQWTGVPHLHEATFNVVHPTQTEGDSRGGWEPHTCVEFPAVRGREPVAGFCDASGYPPEHKARMLSRLVVGARSAVHQNFWEAMEKRHQQVADSPVEFWWHLLCLRSRGVDRASRALLTNLGLVDLMPRRAVVTWENKKLTSAGRTAAEILSDGTYERPGAMVVHGADSAVAFKTNDVILSTVIKMAYLRTGDTP